MMIFAFHQRVRMFSEPSFFIYKKNGRISPTVDLDLPQLTEIR